MKNILTVIVVIFSCASCSLDGLVKVSEPEIGSLVDPKFLNSREGVIALFHTSLAQFQRSVSYMSRDVGIFTDELTVNPDGLQHGWTLIEARIEETDSWGRKGVYVDGYSTLQKARVAAVQTRDLARLINRDELSFLFAATYAIEGFSILMLAENFCSGVPLTRVSFEGKVEYSSAASTEKMLENAVALFDSALAIDHDSLRYSTLAKMGKARAYLALGRYEDAVLASSEIEENDRFEISYSLQNAPGALGANLNVFWTGYKWSLINWYDESQIINNDGINGQVWFDSVNAIDPRVKVTTEVKEGKLQFTQHVRQKKFTGDAKFPVAHNIHHKLIKAEYLLSKEDPGWLDILNEMRRGINLVDTADPGDTESRVNLLFRERAYWLFLEGTRLSDMRRLVRQYRRDPFKVFPTGRYDLQPVHLGIEFFGDAYVFIPDSDEFLYNHKYYGCIHKNP